MTHPGGNPFRSPNPDGSKTLVLKANRATWILGRHRSTSLLIVLGGFLTQVAIFPFLLLFGLSTSDSGNQLIQFAVEAAMIVWFCIPLVSLAGIASAIAALRIHGAHVLPLIGVILNSIWFLLFVLVSYIVFVVRITV